MHKQLPKSKIFEAWSESLVYLKKRYEIDVETGEIWNLKSGDYADKFHFFKHQSDPNVRYKQVQVYLGINHVLYGKCGKQIKISAHRMVWAFQNGRWPNIGMDIDHLNSNTSDNRICNLMEVTEADNASRINQRRLVTPAKAGAQ